MAKLTAKRLPQGGTAAARVVHIEADTNPLVWRVSARGGAPSFLIDLTAFAAGDAEMDLPARPVLIGQLAPEIRAWTIGKTKGTVAENISKLRVFWRFLAAMDVSGGVADDIAAITPAIGVLFKNYLLNDLRYGPDAARSGLKGTQAFLEAARRRVGLKPHLLLWPTVQQPRGTKHKDVDPASMRRLYNVAKGVVRRFAAAHAEGRQLVQQGIDPRVPGQRQKMTPEWRSPANVAWLTAQFLRQVLDDPQARLETISPEIYRRPTEGGAMPRGFEQGRIFDRMRWCVPLAEDVAAAVALVLLHTGWNVDTVFNIDVSGPATWCRLRLASDAGETVAIFGNKGRTHREQVAFSLVRPEFRPYRVIKDMVERTEPLREALRRRLAAVEAEQTSPGQQDRIISLRRAIASPWLFLRMTTNDPLLGRVGVMSQRTNSSVFAPLFQSLCTEAGIEEPLTPSDLRDGFASFLYTNSLFNTLLVKRALGHQNLSATKHYLRQRRMLAQRFADYTAWSEAMFEEIQRFQAVDPTILYIRARFGEVTDAQRRHLADHRLRTRMGMGCLDPEHPPETLAPLHGKGLCAVQRCTLCRHGVIFQDSFQPLAYRLAELRVIRGHTPLGRWEGSSFQAEWIAIEATVERVFPGRTAEFEAVVDAHVERLRAGDAYLFDQIGAGEISGAVA